jgi:hypothetical protein
MATYTNITAGEMSEFLCKQGFSPITLPGVRELVWGKVVQIAAPLVKVSMRIYSGIDASGNSRDVGTDAIRVEFFWKDAQGEIIRIGGSKRVHRVANWRGNLQARINDWRECFGPLCKCGAPMVLRTVRKDGPNKGREFYSCANWRATKCDGFQWADLPRAA